MRKLWVKEIQLNKETLSSRAKWVVGPIVGPGEYEIKEKRQMVEGQNNSKHAHLPVFLISPRMSFPFRLLEKK